MRVLRNEWTKRFESKHPGAAEEAVKQGTIPLEWLARQMMENGEELSEDFPGLSARGNPLLMGQCAEAISEIGLFGNQNTACKPLTPKWRHTVERLKQRFPDFDK